VSHSLSSLREQLAQCLLKDRHDLSRRIGQLEQRQKQNQPIDQPLQKIADAVAQSMAVRAQRSMQDVVLEYDSQLPVVEKREEIARAIAEHQVVIVCGETGSGKTTQLPKICLALGRGVDGLIGHTQPRRIAARSVAARIAEELKSELGSLVGFKVRFSDHVSERSRIKLMTDGILLAETQGDRFLNQYDTLIIDEAHERSLNIDFLLGYLKQLLPKRPDLKVIITSATIDPERFSRHFNNAPIIQVSGRTYPVEIRYRPLLGEDDDERDGCLEQAIIDAVDELHRIGPGDVLIFLPGEREIRETAEALRKHHPPGTEILPLFSRLSAAEQNLIFKPSGGKRRIVLATNVAETSLTVPGIRYVIDTGLARISRYSYRSKIQRLPVEAISQASANQRSGRCGRVSAGVCIRLYSEQDFNSRAEFTDAEILRTNLASVILQMAALGLGDVSRFPFVDAPDDRLVKDGQRLLFELQAVDEKFRLTEAGRKLARLPVDPRLARMVISAGQWGALHEVLIICAALSIQDPRERPMEKQQAADEKHRRFADESSDFIGFINLWKYLQEQERHLSQNKFRALCKKEFISYVRYREWREVLGQLRQIATELELRENDNDADFSAIHRSLLSGLLGNIGLKLEKNEFLGARNRHFHIFPGSGLFKKSPQWVMAAEIVETAQVYARVVAKIDPDWIEPMAVHLIKRSYFDPHWEKRVGEVAAFERVSLYGLPVVAKRKINYGPIEPAESREIFVRHGLVTGEINTHAAFFKHNQQLVAEVETLEAKTRRQDIMVDDEVLAEFYLQRIPEQVYSLKTFDTWRKQAEQENSKLLFLTMQDLMRQQADHVTANRYPEQLSLAGNTYRVSYQFEPGNENDGVNLHVPLGLLSTLPEAPLQWLVPGMLEEKLLQLIKSLPKSLRKNFVPAPNFAQACLQKMTASDKDDLLESLTHQLKRMTGVEVPRDQWQMQNLPPFLFMNICVHDENGKLIASGRDLNDLRARMKGKLDKSFAKLPDNTLEQSGLQSWSFADLPAQIDIKQSGMAVKGYPALIDDGESVAIKVLGDPIDARQQHAQGLLRLFMLCAGKQAKYLLKNLPGIDRMCLQYSAVGKCNDLKEDFVRAVFREVFLADNADIRTQAEFEQRLQQGSPKLVSMTNDYCKAVAEALEAYHELNKKLKGRTSPLWLHSLADIKNQAAQLVHEGFVWSTPWSWLQHLPRYLQAMLRRIDRLPGNETKDRERMLSCQKLWELYQTRAAETDRAELVEFRWMIEELRVSLFAQDLKTLKPVSDKRLHELWRAIPKG